MANCLPKPRNKRLHLVVGALLLNVSVNLVKEGSPRRPAVLAELAADQVKRLDTIGTLIDHRDAGIAYELLHAVLGDVTVAAEYLLRHDRVGKPNIGEHTFDHRREQAHVVVGALALLIILGAAGGGAASGRAGSDARDGG